MKGLVLAGGTGSRLRPLTYTSAKQLIPVANRPILFSVLDDLAAAGITEVGIVIAPETGEEIRAAVGLGEEFGVEVTYIEQDEPKGLAHAVLVAEAFLGEDPFLMYLGDNLLQHGVVDLVEEFERERPDALIPLCRVPEPQHFGVAEIDGDRVVALVEKPEEPPSDLALVGAYLFGRGVVDAARSIEPSWRGELEITDAIQALIADGRDVRFQVVRGFWKDLGKLSDLLEGNRLVLDGLESRIEGEVDAASKVEGRVVVEAGAKIVRSRVVGPCIVGRGAEVVDAYVGPYTSVGDGCRVSESEVENSILLAGACLQGVRRVTESLLGREAEVVRDPQAPAAYRFMLGDRSSVGVPE